MVIKWGENAVVHEVRVRDVAYQRQGDREFLARLYEPQGPGPFPALLEVHGGNWTGGSREANEIIDEALAASGILVAAIDFRQPPEGGYPDSIQDVNLGMRWLKAHARNLYGGSASVVAVGMSSGGHQVALAALRPLDPRYSALALDGAPDVDATMDFIMICWPIVDPYARYQMATASDRQDMIQGMDAYWVTEEAMAEGSPTLILERKDTGLHLPPALLIHGTDDDNMTPDMGDRYAEAYRGMGGSIQHEKFEGAPHGFIKKDPASDATAGAMELMKEFPLRARN